LNNIKLVYNNFARTYDENRLIFDMSEVFDSFYKSLESTQSSILDLGCGSGEPFSKMFVDRGWEVTGVDFSEEMLKLASRYVPQMKTICSDMCDVKFKDSTFEAITLIYSLFHVPCIEHEELFKRFYNWLKPGGKVLFTYAAKEYTGHDEFNGCITFMEQELFYSHTTPENLFNTLKNIGFKIESDDYKNIGGEIFLWVTISKKRTL
jgi:ubiquinone/menaquinone biosynthesis C-methylase UbiE